MFRTVQGHIKIAALIGIAIIFFLGSKKKSFVPTYETYTQLQEIEEKLQFTKSGLATIGTLREEVAYLNAKIGAVDVKAEMVQQQLLEFAKNLKGAEVKEVEQIHQYFNGTFNIYTHTIALKGDFTDLLKALYQFEKEFNTSRVVGFSFKSIKKNNRVLKDQVLTIKIQNYEKIN